MNEADELILMQQLLVRMTIIPRFFALLANVGVPLQLSLFRHEIIVLFRPKALFDIV